MMEMMEMMITEGSSVDFHVQMANYGKSKKIDANTSGGDTDRVRHQKAIIKGICQQSRIHQDSMEMIQCWLKCKVDVTKLNIADGQTGRNALMNAIELLGVDAALEFLKDSTINIEHRDKKGETALMVA